MPSVWRWRESLAATRRAMPKCLSYVDISMPLMKISFLSLAGITSLKYSLASVWHLEHPYMNLQKGIGQSLAWLDVT